MAHKGKSDEQPSVPARKGVHNRALTLTEYRSLEVRIQAKGQHPIFGLAVWGYNTRFEHAHADYLPGTSHNWQTSQIWPVSGRNTS